MGQRPVLPFANSVGFGLDREFLLRSFLRPPDGYGLLSSAASRPSLLASISNRRIPSLWELARASSFGNASISPFFLASTPPVPLRIPSSNLPLSLLSSFQLATRFTSCPALDFSNRPGAALSSLSLPRFTASSNFTHRAIPASPLLLPSYVVTRYGHPRSSSSTPYTRQRFRLFHRSSSNGMPRRLFPRLALCKRGTIPLLRRSNCTQLSHSGRLDFFSSPNSVRSRFSPLSLTVLLRTYAAQLSVPIRARLRHGGHHPARPLQLLPLVAPSALL